MNDAQAKDMMSAVVQKVVNLFDEGAISEEITRKVVSAVVEVYDTWGGETEDLFALMPERCTMCFKQTDVEALVDWMAVPPDDELSVEQLKAFNNSFGPSMTGAKICRHCLASLPELPE